MAQIVLWQHGIYLATFASNPLKWREKSFKLQTVPKAFTFLNLTRPITHVMEPCRKPTTFLFEAALIFLKRVLK